MMKLKVCAALAGVAGLLCVGGLAFQAAGQAPAPRPEKPADVRLVRGAGSRDLTDLELLRKEVDILKLQVEVLQDKVRALQSGPQAGKATEAAAPPGAMRPAGMPGMPGGPGMPGPGAGVPGPGGPATGGLNRMGPGPGGMRGGMRRPGGAGGAPDAVSQAEAALKALREARDPEARRRATDALERAVRQLRGRPAEAGKPSGAPQRE